MWRRCRTTVVVTFSAAAALLAGCGDHASKADATASPAVSVNPRRDASTWATHILIATDAARRSIARADRTGAASAVDQALSFSDKLGSRTQVPLYSELSTVSIVGPSLTAKKEEAANGGKTGGSSADQSKLATAGAAPAPPTTVQAVSSGYSRIVLNADQARARLLAAKAELARDDLAAADRDLRAVQAGVVLESVAANLPLVRARENLALASQSVADGKSDQAQTQLLAAQRALQTFANAQPTASHSSAALAMAAKIAALQSAQTPPTVAQIDDMWAQVASWTDVS